MIVITMAIMMIIPTVRQTQFTSNAQKNVKKVSH